MEVCAVAALCGVPVERIVEGDEVTRAAYVRIAARAGELRQQLMKAQAAHTADQVGRLFRRA
jgi:hypothetical protein